MPLSAGARLGPYEILSAIGAGGMGEVYRGRDTKLNRDVALKILPTAFALDPDRLARFKREAQVLASLNHPNIAAIFGFEESNGVQALVLELVDGPTLADRIARGPIPLDDALPIARQICEALEAAHEQGIIHRDLKPANIKLRPDGTVKVLDFGLAKALEPVSAIGADVTASPTITSPAMTRMGVILGTAAYMSPEQAKGRPADRRSDVWAFGCVLYEMLTGKRAFEGEDVSDTLAAVLRGGPDWNALAVTVPVPIRILVQRCLDKDRRQRIAEIAVAHFVLTEPTSLGPASTIALPPRIAPNRVVVGAGIGLAAGLVLAMIGASIGARMNAAGPPQPVHFAIVPPAGQPLSLQVNDRDIAISPDGTRIVYRAGGQAQLVVRAIDQLDAAPLASITNVRGPFISPDGHWVGFFAEDELKKVSITGGPPITLCRIKGAPRGASWGEDGTIVFATSDAATGLMSVPAGGGEAKILTTPDSGQGDHMFPSVLPDGRGVLFTISASNSTLTTAGLLESAAVAVLDLKSGERKILIHGGGHAEYLPTGHLVYAAAGTLRAVRFNLARLQVLSDPVPVLERVTTTGSGEAEFAISRGGTLVYVPGSAGAGAPRTLVWVTRQGREEPLKVPLRAYVYPRISPDGTRVALDVRDQNNDIWIWDFRHQTLTPLTFDPAADVFPVWTPDARRIVFSSARSGPSNMFWQAADGTGTVERLTTNQNQQLPTSFSPDGKSVAVTEVTSGSYDIALLTLGNKPKTEPLIHTTFDEMNAEISPNGGWIAYQSNESGQAQVYVRPFPEVDSGRWQVSTGGGTRPLWARNGGELFYLDGNNLLTAVPVQITGATFSTGNPAKLLDTPYYTALNGRTYDISPDGQRFLMIKDAAPSQVSTVTPASMIVILNWFEELKQRVPTK